MLYVLLLNIDISEGRLEYFFLMKEYRCFFLFVIDEFNNNDEEKDFILLFIIVICCDDLN